jgi:heat shock protein HslJ
MKNLFTVFIVSVFAFLILAACAKKTELINDVAVEHFEMSSPSFGQTQGKVWVLEELVSESGKTTINRQKLEADGLSDVYTMVVDGDQISGKAAPNRYHSPYRLGEDQGISISPIAGTLMMSVKEIEGLQEQEYYNYLEQVNQWFLVGDKLELYSETPEGEPIILVFTSEDQ